MALQIHPVSSLCHCLFLPLHLCRVLRLQASRNMHIVDPLKHEHNTHQYPLKYHYSHPSPCSWKAAYTTTKKKRAASQMEQPNLSFFYKHRADRDLWLEEKAL